MYYVLKSFRGPGNFILLALMHLYLFGQGMVKGQTMHMITLHTHIHQTIFLQRKSGEKKPNKKNVFDHLTLIKIKGQIYIFQDFFKCLYMITTKNTACQALMFNRPTPIIITP